MSYTKKEALRPSLLLMLLMSFNFDALRHFPVFQAQKMNKMIK